MSLRSQVMRGGAYLAIRQVLGIAIGLANALVLTRLIGPAAYGLFAASLGVLAVLERASLAGIGVYLVRMPRDDRPERWDQAFTLLALFGLVVAAASPALAAGLAWWTAEPRLRAVALAVFLALPLGLLAQVPAARCERALDFKRIAGIELAGQFALFLGALAVALAGFGVWAPVVGWWLRQVTTASLLYASAGHRPRLHWEPALVRDMMGYGLGFTASTWTGQLRGLVNPLVVGRYGGAEAVAYVALTIRLVEMLAFLKGVTWRLSIAALARLGGERARLVRAVGEGLRLQVLAIGPGLTLFGWLAPWVVPRFFGAAWLPVLDVYPFVALSYLTNAAFSLHASALYTLRRNLDVLVYGVAHAAILAAAAFALVPSLGVLGYGLAEACTLASYVVLHACFVRWVGRPDYQLGALWWAAFSISLFGRALGWWSVAGLVLVALWPGTWREIRELTRGLRGLRHDAAVAG